MIFGNATLKALNLLYPSYRTTSILVALGEILQIEPQSFDEDQDFSKYYQRLTSDSFFQFPADDIPITLADFKQYLQSYKINTPYDISKRFSERSPSFFDRFLGRLKKAIFQHLSEYLKHKRMVITKPKKPCPIYYLFFKWALYDLRYDQTIDKLIVNGGAEKINERFKKVYNRKLEEQMQCPLKQKEREKSRAIRRSHKKKFGERSDLVYNFSTMLDDINGRFCNLLVDYIAFVFKVEITANMLFGEYDMFNTSYFSEGEIRPRSHTQFDSSKRTRQINEQFLKSIFDCYREYAHAYESSFFHSLECYYQSFFLMRGCESRQVGYIPPSHKQTLMSIHYSFHRPLSFYHALSMSEIGYEQILRNAGTSPGALIKEMSEGDSRVISGITFTKDSFNNIKKWKEPQDHQELNNIKKWKELQDYQELKDVVTFYQNMEVANSHYISKDIPWFRIPVLYLYKLDEMFWQLESSKEHQKKIESRTLHGSLIQTINQYFF